MITTVLLLLFDFLSLKNDENVPSKSNMQKNFFLIVFCWRLEGQWGKIAGSGSAPKCHGSATLVLVLSYSAYQALAPSLQRYSANPPNLDSSRTLVLCLSSIMHLPFSLTRQTHQILIVLVLSHSTYQVSAPLVQPYSANPPNVDSSRTVVLSTFRSALPSKPTKFG